MSRFELYETCMVLSPRLYDPVMASTLLLTEGHREVPFSCLSVQMLRFCADASVPSVLCMVLAHRRWIPCGDDSKNSYQKNWPQRCQESSSESRYAQLGFCVAVAAQCPDPLSEPFGQQSLNSSVDPRVQNSACAKYPQPLTAFPCFCT